MTTYARLYGVDADTAYFMQTTSGDPIVMADTETVVLALGHHSDGDLEADLANLGADYDGEVHVIGDCVTPRTVEEAVLEGLEAGVAI